MFRTLTTSRRFAPFPAFLRAIWRLVFRLEVVGQDSLAPIGAAKIIVVAHDSWLDSPILFSLLETPATFVIDAAAAKDWPQRLFLRSADARVLDPAKPLALRALVREARRGRRLVLFLDTRSAVAGQSMTSFDVAARCAEACAANRTAGR